MRQYEYKCSKCNAPCERDLLTVKNVRFLEIGEKPKQLRSRNVGWLCPACVAADPDWNRDPHLRAVPGEKRTAKLHDEVYDAPDLQSALQVGSKWQVDGATN